MTSERAIAANRINARKGRGPRTRYGKSRASRNALRHGLSTFSRENPKISQAIEVMAKALCGDDQDPRVREQALIIAEAEIVLRCVRTEKILAIERMWDVRRDRLQRGITQTGYTNRLLSEAKSFFRSSRRYEISSITRSSGPTEPAYRRCKGAAHLSRSVRKTRFESEMSSTRCARPCLTSAASLVMSGARGRAANEPFVSSLKSSQRTADPRVFMKSRACGLPTTAAVKVDGNEKSNAAHRYQAPRRTPAAI